MASPFHSVQISHNDRYLISSNFFCKILAIDRVIHHFHAQLFQCSSGHINKDEIKQDTRQGRFYDSCCFEHIRFKDKFKNSFSIALHGCTVLDVVKASAKDFKCLKSFLKSKAVKIVKETTVM